MMRITRIRLVNFHNFIDETVEVEGGGHLFLLGDNGSGKTTILDAVHYVLSGAKLELNAAARLGGRKDEGRSIQGIVLRHDFERGVRNEDGAIAYAAVELCDGDRRLVVGVGTEATTLEARVTRWGFATSTPLEALPLVVEHEGDRFAATREALRAALPAGEVFLRVGEYRAHLAARLFGGPGVYEEVCRFWSMAKAYREIVSGARDFGALFRRLLPGPDPVIFGEIVRSLRNLGDLEAALGELERQRDHVAGLLDLAGVVTAEREAASRCRWLLCFRRGEETRAELAESEGDELRLREEGDRLAREASAAEARLERADDAVRAARCDDRAELLRLQREADGRTAELGGEVAERERDEAAQAELSRAAEEGSATAAADLDELFATIRADVEVAVTALSQVPGDLPRARALAASLTSAGDGDHGALARAARDDAVKLDEAAKRRRNEAGARLERARAVEEQREAELEALATRAEEQPRVPGFAAAREALAAAGIAARPVYELLEPTADAAPERLAWLESLAGDGQLAALVTAPDDRARAAAVVAGAAPGVRVVVDADTAAARAAALPTWARSLLSPAEPDALTAVAALAAAIAQPRAFGAIGAAGDGLLAHRGTRLAPENAAPRLLGRAARERAQKLRVAEATSARHAAVTARADAERALEQADRRCDQLRLLGTAIDRAGGAELARAEARLASARTRAARERSLASDASARADASRARLAEARTRADGLRARADGIDLGEIEARLAALDAQAADARKTWRDLQARRGVFAADLERLGSRRERLAAALAAATSELGDRTVELRRLVPALANADDDAIARHVRFEQRGDSFKSIATIEDRLATCQRREALAAAELGGDGSRGVRNIHFAGRFGFDYDAAGNRLTDRRDQPAAGVLAELERTVAEQREVITAETRELMETLVVSSLARDLQTQIDTLERLIRDINRLLGDIRFGRSGYQFRAAARPERREIVEVIKRVSILDADSRATFRTWIEDRLDELRCAAEDEVPELLDYRSWFDYSLRLTSAGDGGVDLTRSVRALGSGGEQGVPNYLLVLALGKLMFESSGARLRPLLFDEAFYGIDAGRRDQLLRFATELELQLLVASPDQDGATPSARQATTLFIVKDGDGDVHMAPYHYWNHAPPAQPDLFAEPAPTEPPPDDAECRLDAPPSG